MVRFCMRASGRTTSQMDTVASTFHGVATVMRGRTARERGMGWACTYGQMATVTRATGIQVALRLTAIPTVGLMLV